MRVPLDTIRPSRYDKASPVLAQRAVAREAGAGCEGNGLAAIPPKPRPFYARP